MYWHSQKTVPYPGEGVYDLTAYVPCLLSGTIHENERELLEFEFWTNSTEIRVTNEADSDVTVYLYDASYDVNVSVGLFSVASGESNKFTNLTSATNYRIAVESPDNAYSIKISD